jgi:hypothetical protein
MMIAMDDASQPIWSPRAKAIVSALVALHVAAVFIAPMSFAVRPGSPAVDPLKNCLRPYIQALFLDHGYAFFAPDPGPSHLVEYKLTFDNGRQAETARFPDIDEHFPRLLYHRHFMLSESLQTYYTPERAPRLPATMDAAERSERLANWRSARQNYVALRDSFARHLAAENHATSAQVHRIRHDFLPPSQFTRERDLDGPLRMNDARTYVDLDELDTAEPPRGSGVRNSTEARSNPIPAPAVEEYVPGVSLPRGASVTRSVSEDDR